MNGIQKVSGSIPLISTTHLIHHICPMWFFLFIPLTAISDSLDFMHHFVPLKSVPYFVAASFHCFSSISQTLRFTGISDSLDFMRHFIPLKSVPYFAAASSHCFISISQTLRFPGISDLLDFMRHFAPLKSVPYLAAVLFHCFIFISQTPRFPGISDSLDSMRHFISLESVPYLTGSIPLISTTYLIHHICPMWFFLFIPLTAIRLTRFHASLCSFEIGSLLCRCLISLLHLHVPISPLHRHK